MAEIMGDEGRRVEEEVEKRPSLSLKVEQTKVACSTFNGSSS